MASFLAPSCSPLRSISSPRPNETFSAPRKLQWRLLHIQMYMCIYELMPRNFLWFTSNTANRCAYLPSSTHRRRSTDALWRTTGAASSRACPCFRRAPRESAACTACLQRRSGPGVVRRRRCWRRCGPFPSRPTTRNSGSGLDGRHVEIRSRCVRAYDCVGAHSAGAHAWRG